jgi:hypothetical protein
MDTKLVHEVEKHPALYNPKRRGYKDTAEMDRSWLQIANELGMKRKSFSLSLTHCNQQIIVHSPNACTSDTQLPLMYLNVLSIPFLVFQVCSVLPKLSMHSFDSGIAKSLCHMC